MGRVHPRAACVFHQYEVAARSCSSRARPAITASQRETRCRRSSYPESRRAARVSRARADVARAPQPKQAHHIVRSIDRRRIAFGTDHTLGTHGWIRYAPIRLGNSVLPFRRSVACARHNGASHAQGHVAISVRDKELQLCPLNAQLLRRGHRRESTRTCARLTASWFARHDPRVHSCHARDESSFASARRFDRE